MTKPTMQSIKRLAAKIGATIEDTSTRHEHSYNVSAPNGKRWIVDGGLHDLVMAWPDASTVAPCDMQAFKEIRESEIKATMERMTDGLEDCPPDCHCKEE